MARWKGPALFVCLALVFVLTPHLAFAQSGIAGTVRDSQGGVLPGVTVEASSPQLIEKVRATVTDSNGRYQIVGLPTGTYSVVFKLEKFATVSREKVELSADFTAPISVEMKLGAASEIVTVIGTEGGGQVDVVNARQRQVFSRDELIDLPTTRNLNSLIQLVPGIAVSAAPGGGLNSVPTICSGGAADGAAGAFNTSGGLSGCTPLIQGFNAHSSMNDPESINQGRMQVDGLGVQSFGGGGRSNYIADISNAQEVTFTLSGSLGESETGGTTINVIPRTGGNRYSGNFFTAYSNGHFFGKNNETRSSTFTNRMDREYDVNAAYGGPVIRDRLWFYGAARRQDRNSLLTTAYRNLNEGIFGANFRRDVNSRVMQDDMYQNASMRLTVQATQKDKFNLFWDEQYTCENPCHGTSGSPTSVEASSSPISHPLHLAQLSWTNPFTSKILLEAGVSHYGSHRDESRNISEIAYNGIPRVSETGSTVDSINAVGTTTGSINNAVRWNIDNIQSRASASYVTGSHNVKLGYQGQYLSRVSDPFFNDLRLAYAYATPASTCTTTAPALGAVNNGNAWCGLAPDGSANNVTRIPVPTTVTQFIPAGSDETAWFSSFYLQDQWTLNRFTFSGALRYDNAQSQFGKTCVGPDVHTQYQYCLNDPANGDDGRGVYFQDITPRIGMAWDMFGNGKTSLKFSTGKYLSGAQAGGIYTASNPATGNRTINSYTRLWRDIDGDRQVDCDLQVPAVAPNASSFPNSGECGPTTDTITNTARRFGQSPDALDDSGQAIGLGTLYCGQYERSMSQAIAAYCQNYFAAGGKPLLNGWGVRQYEWQMSIGIQHEILPRFSGEVTYNRRQGGNQTVTDLIGSGCDLYSLTDGGTVNSQQCMEDLLNFKSPNYDFYAVQAPTDARLPGGGGYKVPGFATLKQTGCTATDANTGACTNASFATLPASAGVNAVTLVQDGAQQEFWSGVDTNFVLRAKGGLRVSGGTSTGRRVLDTCKLMVNDPPTGQVLREGRERLCDAVRPMQTNVRGTVSYTIPWVDVLASAVFSVRPGVTINANYQVALTDITFQEGAVRYTPQLSGGAATVTQNLVSNDTFGEHIRLVDFKLAKNIRFAGKRLNVGVDVYNVFNSDAALGYCATFPNPSQLIEGCGTAAAGNLAPWGTVNNITTPRYARFQLQFDF